MNITYTDCPWAAKLELTDQEKENLLLKFKLSVVHQTYRGLISSGLRPSNPLVRFITGYKYSVPINRHEWDTYKGHLDTELPPEYDVDLLQEGLSKKFSEEWDNGHHGLCIGLPESLCCSHICRSPVWVRNYCYRCAAENILDIDTLGPLLPNVAQFIRDEYERMVMDEDIDTPSYKRLRWRMSLERTEDKTRKTLIWNATSYLAYSQAREEAQEREIAYQAKRA